MFENLTTTEHKKHQKRDRENLINPTVPIFTIGAMSLMLEVHQRTLRIYDDEGLLVPTRTDRNRRLYSLDDVEKGKFIQYLTRNLGINLSGVRIIMGLLEDQKLEIAEYAPEIQRIAKFFNISEEDQRLKRESLLKRGRKPKNAK